MLLFRGEVLFSQGDEGDLYELVSGLLKVIKVQENGECVLLNILERGEVFPHHSLISPKSYHATVVALTKSEVKKIPAEEWYHSLSEHPEEYKRVALILQENLRKMQRRIDLTALPAQARLNFFREHMYTYWCEDRLEELLTQEEMGQFLGLSRETVNRLLRKDSLKKDRK